ncbi:MAG: thioredoxin [Oscillospiraceae bacterium]|nr:thioredoxin [Oscillospiraceae bacterium]
MAEVKVTVANFEAEVLGSDIPVLLDFWAPWCGPCRMLAPTLEEIAREYEGRVKVGKVNTDEDPELAVKYGIISIPTVLLFNGGELKGSTVGLQSKEALEKLIEKA